MDSPSFREHGAKAECEASHEDPGLHCADVSEGWLRGERGVETQDDDTGVAEETSNNYQIIQVWRGHLNLSEKDYNYL